MRGPKMRPKLMKALLRPMAMPGGTSLRLEVIAVREGTCRATVKPKKAVASRMVRVAVRQQEEAETEGRGEQGSLEHGGIAPAAGERSRKNALDEGGD